MARKKRSPHDKARNVVWEFVGKGQIFTMKELIATIKRRGGATRFIQGKDPSDLMDELLATGTLKKSDHHTFVPASAYRY